MPIEVIITKSNKSNKKYDAIVDGKKQLVLDKTEQVILLSIMITKENNHT